MWASQGDENVPVSASFSLSHRLRVFEGRFFCPFRCTTPLEQSPTSFGTGGVSDAVRTWDAEGAWDRTSWAQTVDSASTELSDSLLSRSLYGSLKAENWVSVRLGQTYTTVCVSRLTWGLQHLSAAETPLTKCWRKSVRMSMCRSPLPHIRVPCGKSHPSLQLFSTTQEEFLCQYSNVNIQRLRKKTRPKADRWCPGNALAHETRPAGGHMLIHNPLRSPVLTN